MASAMATRATTSHRLLRKEKAVGRAIGRDGESDDGVGGDIVHYERDSPDGDKSENA